MWCRNLQWWAGRGSPFEMTWVMRCFWVCGGLWNYLAAGWRFALCSHVLLACCLSRQSLFLYILSRWHRVGKGSSWAIVHNSFRVSLLFVGLCNMHTNTPENNDVPPFLCSVATCLSGLRKVVHKLLEMESQNNLHVFRNRVQLATFNLFVPT